MTSRSLGTCVIHSGNLSNAYHFWEVWAEYLTCLIWDVWVNYACKVEPVSMTFEKSEETPMTYTVWKNSFYIFSLRKTSISLLSLAEFKQMSHWANNIAMLSRLLTCYCICKFWRFDVTISTCVHQKWNAFCCWFVMI